MIDAIREVGVYSIKKNKKELIDVLTDSPNPTNKEGIGILFISLEQSEIGFEYKGIDREEFSKDKLGKYLYKKGDPNGPDLTPTSMVTDLEKTFSKVKILPWFKEYDQIGLDEDINFLARIGKCIRINKENILNDLKQKYTKEYNIISLKIDDKYIGEYEIFQTKLKEKANKDFYSNSKTISKADNKLCSVCSCYKKEVYGFVNTYKFYTVDKPGFVSGGFRQKDAWKNYPVCFECAIELEAGKKYLKDNLDFNFDKFKYNLIPKFIGVVKEDVKQDVLKRIENWKKNIDFKKDTIKRLTSDEEEILEELSKEKNYLNLDFMFYNAPRGYDGSEFNIVLYIPSILPSDLKKLFDAKREIDKIGIFKECIIGKKLLEFNFGIVRMIFPQISNNRTYDRYFLDMVNKIFTRKRIDYEFLMSFIMRKVRDDFANEYNLKIPILKRPILKISILKSFMLINFLKKLDILGTTTMTENNGQHFIDNERQHKMIFNESASEKQKEIDTKIYNFFNGFKNSFEGDDCNAKKGIFLEGVLVQKLLNIQRLPEVSNAQPGKEPFRPRLKGLKLDERHIKKLLPEIQNKLEEYGKNYYRALESILSYYFVAAGTNWKLSNNDISFYFTLGMNLSYLFKTEKETGDEDNE